MFIHNFFILVSFLIVSAQEFLFCRTFFYANTVATNTVSRS